MKKIIFSIILLLISLPSFPAEPDSVYIEEFKKSFEQSYLRCSKKADETPYPDDAVLQSIESVPIEDIATFLLYKSFSARRKCMNDIYENEFYFLSSIHINLNESISPKDKEEVISILSAMTHHNDFNIYKKYKAMKAENLKHLESQEYFNQLLHPYKVWNYIKLKRNLGDDLGSP